MHRRTTRGYTLIEILVVLTIFTIIALTSMGSLRNFRKEKLLEGQKEGIASVFSEARFDTLAAVDDKQYGVHIETDKITLFGGGTYSAVDPLNKVYPINTTLHITSISLTGGGADVIYDRITGNTQQYGTFTLVNNTDPTSSSTIRVSGTGILTFLGR